jgi:hypothetical protein
MPPTGRNPNSTLFWNPLRRGPHTAYRGSPTCVFPGRDRVRAPGPKSSGGAGPRFSGACRRRDLFAFVERIPCIQAKRNFKSIGKSKIDICTLDARSLCRASCVSGSSEEEPSRRWAPDNKNTNLRAVGRPVTCRRPVACGSVTIANFKRRPAPGPWPGLFYRRGLGAAIMTVGARFSATSTESLAPPHDSSTRLRPWPTDGALFIGFNVSGSVYLLRLAESSWYDCGDKERPCPGSLLGIVQRSQIGAPQPVLLLVLRLRIGTEITRKEDHSCDRQSPQRRAEASRHRGECSSN